MPRKRALDSLSSQKVKKFRKLCKLSTTNGSDSETSDVSLGHSGDEKEWEEARCPICFDHPHNAVLLICSSFEKGCRPYICDTSRRHSNCLDQFKSQGSASSVCPFCRGDIIEQCVFRDARAFMNSKVRSCSLESCKFSGNYNELREHARQEHPTSHPMEVKPEHHAEWLRLNQEWDLEDVRSMISPSWHESELVRLNQEWIDLRDVISMRYQSWLGDASELVRLNQDWNDLRDVISMRYQSWLGDADSMTYPPRFEFHTDNSFVFGNVVEEREHQTFHPVEVNTELEYPSFIHPVEVNAELEHPTFHSVEVNAELEHPTFHPVEVNAELEHTTFFHRGEINAEPERSAFHPVEVNFDLQQNLVSWQQERELRSARRMAYPPSLVRQAVEGLLNLNFHEGTNFVYNFAVNRTRQS